MKGSYCSIFGSLLYLAIETRPDLGIPAGMLGAHVAQPKEEDWIVAARALRYLNGTNDFALIFLPGKRTALVPFGDSKWGSQYEPNRKGKTDVLVKYRNATIYATGQRQR